MKWIGLFLLTVAGGLSQAVVTTPAFEVASIRPTVFPKGAFGFGSGSIQIKGNKVTARQITAQGLLLYAYGVKDFQIIGVTSRETPWSDFYDIAATTPGQDPPPEDQVRLMVQRLLADRFQLKLHRETRSLPVYNLIVGKNGPKLKASAPGAKSGATASNTDSSSLRITYLNSKISELVPMLNRAADRPVLDKTGLEEGYDFTLEFSRAQPGNKEGNAADSAGTSIFTAVQEQLGLKLDPGKEPMEVLVIDHVEGPSAN
jgi:uncharacterized protein (TIGR03435 family)